MHTQRVTTRLYPCYLNPGHLPPTTSSPITTPILVSLTHIINTGSLLLLIRVLCVHSCWAQTAASCLESGSQKKTLDHLHLVLLGRLRDASSSGRSKQNTHIKDSYFVQGTLISICQRICLSQVKDSISPRNTCTLLNCNWTVYTETDD